MKNIVIREIIGSYGFYVFRQDDGNFCYEVYRILLQSTEKFETSGDARLAAIGHINLLEKGEI